MDVVLCYHHHHHYYFAVFCNLYCLTYHVVLEHLLRSRLRHCKQFTAVMCPECSTNFIHCCKL